MQYHPVNKVEYACRCPRSPHGLPPRGCIPAERAALAWASASPPQERGLPNFYLLHSGREYGLLKILEPVMPH